MKPQQPLQVAFLLYPTERVKVDEDSSFWIMWELRRRGHKVFYFEGHDLTLAKGTAMARLRAAKLDAKRGYLPAPLASQPTDLSKMDCIFIRKEPPFDSEYLYCLQILEMIKHKTFILNDPAGIAMANEKTFILNFPEWSPETLVTQNVESAARFVRNFKHDMVIKPLNHKGGYGVFVTNSKDRNLHSILEVSTQLGRDKVMIQRYLAVDRFGDKRIVLLDGQILGGFLRRPGQRDHRANLSAGGTMHRARITPKERKLVAAVSAMLSRYGLHFVGLDTVDGLLTEINVTSPAGIPEIKQYEKTDVQKDVVDFMERRTSSFVRKHS